jgi:hypothetical protein
VTLIITADGHRLLLFAIFRRKTLPKGKFPQAITARAQERAWMTEELIIKWLNVM